MYITFVFDNFYGFKIFKNFLYKNKNLGLKINITFIFNDIKGYKLIVLLLYFIRIMVLNKI